MIIRCMQSFHELFTPFLWIKTLLQKFVIQSNSTVLFIWFLHTCIIVVGHRQSHTFSPPYLGYFCSGHLQAFHSYWVHRPSAGSCVWPTGPPSLKFLNLGSRWLHDVSEVNSALHLIVLIRLGKLWWRVHSPVCSENNDFPDLPCLLIPVICLSISLWGYFSPWGPRQVLESVMASPERYFSFFALGLPWHFMNPWVCVTDNRQITIWNKSFINSFNDLPVDIFLYCFGLNIKIYDGLLSWELTFSGLLK